MRKLDAAVSGLATRIDDSQNMQRARLLQQESGLLEMQQQAAGDLAVLANAADGVVSQGRHLEVRISPRPAPCGYCHVRFRRRASIGMRDTAHRQGVALCCAALIDTS